MAFRCSSVNSNQAQNLTKIPAFNFSVFFGFDWSSPIPGLHIARRAFALSIDLASTPRPLLNGLSCMAWMNNYFFEFHKG